MPTYLVIHTPRSAEDDATVHPPSDLAGLVRDHSDDTARTRWISTWSPDLHDERHFSLWHAASAEDIREVMERYSFLSEMDSHPICVQEWNAETVRNAPADEA